MKSSLGLRENVDLKTSSRPVFAIDDLSHPIYDIYYHVRDEIKSWSITIVHFMLKALKKHRRNYMLYVASLQPSKFTNLQTRVACENIFFIYIWAYCIAEFYSSMLMGHAQV